MPVIRGGVVYLPVGPLLRMQIHASKLKEANGEKGREERASTAAAPLYVQLRASEQASFQSLAIQ